MKIPLPARVLRHPCQGAGSLNYFLARFFFSSFPFFYALSHWGSFPDFHRTQWFELPPEFSGATHDDHQHFFYMEMFPG